MAYGNDRLKNVLREIRSFSLHHPSFRVWTATFGAHKSRRTGEGMEFREFRPYEMGEDVARIDYEASARTGEKVVRINLTEEKVHYIVAIDVTLSSEFYGIDEMIFAAAGCYMLSAIKARDPVHLVAVGGRNVFISPALYSADGALGSVREAWEWRRDHASHSGQSELAATARVVVPVLPRIHARFLFISDFAFTDVAVRFDAHGGPPRLEGKTAIKNFASILYSAGRVRELACVGAAPCWDDFRSLRGVFSLQDAETGMRRSLRFTRRRAQEFVARQYIRESLWRDAMRSFSIPMTWVHRGRPLFDELARVLQ